MKLSFTDKYVTDSLMSGCSLTDRCYSNQSLFSLHSLSLSVILFLSFITKSQATQKIKKIAIISQRQSLLVKSDL